jgi:hypothetical protein
VDRRGRIVVAAVAGAALVAGAVTLSLSGQPTAIATPPAAKSSPTGSPPPPAVIKDCWVPASTGNVSLTADEAEQLTTVAATAVRPDRREERVRRAVDRLLDVTSAEAATVAASLVGDRRTPRLTCGYSRVDVVPEDAGRSGLTPRARRLRAAWTEVFGPLIAGGFARGGVSSGHVDSSSHYDGRAVDVFFRPLGDAEQRRRGRVFAQWLVAHAQTYNVLSVIYADRIWTSWASYAGWREYVHPSGNRTNAVLRHLDHVHVAVESGRSYRG